MRLIGLTQDQFEEFKTKLLTTFAERCPGQLLKVFAVPADSLAEYVSYQQKIKFDTLPEEEYRMKHEEIAPTEEALALEDYPALSMHKEDSDAFVALCDNLAEEYEEESKGQRQKDDGDSVARESLAQPMGDFDREIFEQKRAKR